MNHIWDEFGRYLAAKRPALINTDGGDLRLAKEAFHAAYVARGKNLVGSFENGWFAAVAEVRAEVLSQLREWEFEFAQQAHGDDSGKSDAKAEAAREIHDHLSSSWDTRDKAESSTAALILERDNLRSALGAMLTHFGMDEDEWTKPTFDQARKALEGAA